MSRSLTDKERAAVLHDLAESRPLLAWYARERAQAIAAMEGHAVKALAAEVAGEFAPIPGDITLAEYHHRMGVRLRDQAERLHERRAMLLQDVRQMERDLAHV